MKIIFLSLLFLSACSEKKQEALPKEFAAKQIDSIDIDTGADTYHICLD